jgi:hypothetical protein
LQSREVPASRVKTPRNLAALRKTQKVSRGFETVFLDESLASRQKVSLSFLQGLEKLFWVPCRVLKSFLSFLSFLLAHCGGGQDKPGLPWPLSEAPRLSFFPWFPLPVFSPRLITSRLPDFIAALVRGHPLPLRRLYLRAGDFHHASRRGWNLPGISPFRGGGNSEVS